MIADTENRTQVTDLQDQGTSHCTISAYTIHYVFKFVVFLLQKNPNSEN